MSTPNVVQPPPGVHPLYEQDLERMWCLEEQKPFTLTRFRRAVVGMARVFFSTAENYLPDFKTQLACLTYNANKPEDSGLFVTAAHGSLPGINDTNKAVVTVRIPSLRYTKMVSGDRAGVSSNLAEVTLSKRCEGTLLIVAAAPEPDVPSLLLEPFRDFLEGTKHVWMRGLQIDEFECEGLQDMDLERKAPDVRYRSTLACKFGGRLNVTRSQVSLPLKRIVLEAIPIAI